ncbi:unnamed protein product [Prunus brigantina]
MKIELKTLGNYKAIWMPNCNCKHAPPNQIKRVRVSN